MERDSLMTGFVVGCIVPVLGYMIFNGVFDMLTQAGFMEEVSIGSASQRLRTLSLLGICSNLLPFNYFKNQRADNSMRGIIFPTLIYIGFWLYTFQHVFFGQ